jgi:tRNA A22 N-methylase
VSQSTQQGIFPDAPNVPIDQTLVVATIQKVDCILKIGNSAQHPPPPISSHAMTARTLTKRMGMAASMLREAFHMCGSGHLRYADIATENGLFPRLMLAHQYFPNNVDISIILSDIVPNGITIANENWNNFGKVNPAYARVTVDCRVGEGLSVLQPGDASIISILGLAANAVERILHSSERLGELGVRYLVVQTPQPNVPHLFRFRRFLYSEQMDVMKETLIEDSGILYSSFFVGIPSEIDAWKYEKAKQLLSINEKSEDFGNLDLYLGKNVEGDNQLLLSFYKHAFSNMRLILKQRKLAQTLDFSSNMEVRTIESILALLEARIKGLEQCEEFKPAPSLMAALNL